MARYDDRFQWRNRERQGEYSQRYGQREPYNGESRYSESQYSEGPFSDPTRAPRYFGMGNYGEGGAHFTGGFDQRGDQTGYQRGDYDYERHAPQSFKRGPKGYQRSDERLKEDISDRIMLASHIDASDVTVNVENAKVTLEGTVPDRYTKHYIEDLADACPGVQDIENRMRVTNGGR